MPRKTAKQETEQTISRFFEEAKAGYMKDILATRQPGRRRALLSEVDALDKVQARFYHWMNGEVTAA
jgi:hypothetical protein